MKHDHKIHVMNHKFVLTEICNKYKMTENAKQTFFLINYYLLRNSDHSVVSDGAGHVPCTDQCLLYMHISVTAIPILF